MPRLKYIGVDRRTDWLPGVPARDLTAAEAKQYPEAAASAFYVVDTKSEPSPAAPGEQEQE